MEPLLQFQGPWSRGREPTSGAQLKDPPVQRELRIDREKDAFQRQLKNLLGRKLFSVKFKGAGWNPKHSTVRNVDSAF